MRPVRLKKQTRNVMDEKGKLQKMLNKEPLAPSNQPNSNHGNKKNDRAHDNMSKKLGWCDRRVISGK